MPEIILLVSASPGEQVGTVAGHAVQLKAMTSSRVAFVHNDTMVRVRAEDTIHTLCQRWYEKRPEHQPVYAPPPVEVECCASGSCEVCRPGMYRG